MNLNKVYLIGRVTNNPEVKNTPTGQTVCKFGLATNRVWIDRNTNQKQEKAEFHNIVMWSKMAETASKYLNKGSLVMIEGRLQTSNWQDQSGNKKYKTEIIAENMQLGPRAAGSYANNSGYQKPMQTASAEIPKEEIPIIEDNTTPPIEAAAINEEEEIDVKNIPF
ncbi:MAG: single-stranded DNA-binding protein [Candidatus Nealsonbacteria bacterium]|nr:single-stranded DNA-binding protein [Candidatus Nealsonbacteria bacterium]